MSETNEMRVVGGNPASDARGTSAGAGRDGAAQGLPASAGARVKVRNVQGAFSFSQDVVTPTAQIVRDLRDVARVVPCGAGAGSAPASGSRPATTLASASAPASGSAPAAAGVCVRVAAAGDTPSPAPTGAGLVAVAPAPRTARAATASALDWEITVAGAVNQAFSARLGELACSGESDAVMSYTCLENPSGGRATANAGTTGIPLVAILDRAGGVWEGANVIAFTSADGFDVRLPLDYVLGRTSMIAYRLNGASLKETLGCTNQLWMGGAPAHYFVRDVVRIGVERVAAAKVPPSPGVPLAGESYASHPNVGVLNGLLKGAQQGEIA